MKLSSLGASAVFLTSLSFAQSPARVAARSTLPIVFTRTLDASHAHTGDSASAKTIQAVPLADGQAIPSGATVTGHVVDAVPFVFDKTPYAQQHEATLTIHFDSVATKGASIPLNVYVRALADPISSWDARKPRPSDEDPDETTVQIGVEIFEPHQGQVVDRDGDVVGYEHRGGIYAHLLATSGNSPEVCDGGGTEVPVALFSASACGLYGFIGVSLVHSGRTGNASTLVWSARRFLNQLL